MEKREKMTKEVNGKKVERGREDGEEEEMKG